MFVTACHMSMWLCLLLQSRYQVLSMYINNHHKLDNNSHNNHSTENNDNDNNSNDNNNNNNNNNNEVEGI